MLKLDNTLLDELGLGGLPEDQKKAMLQHIYETLELRVGTDLANQMSDQQLEEFEKFIDAGGEANQAQALQWLESNLPNYKDVVNRVFEELKGEVRAMAPQIMAASLPAGQPVSQQPAPAAPMAQPQMPVGGAPYQQPAMPMNQYDDVSQKGYGAPTTPVQPQMPYQPAVVPGAYQPQQPMMPQQPTPGYGPQQPAPMGAPMSSQDPMQFQPGQPMPQGGTPAPQMPSPTDPQFGQSQNYQAPFPPTQPPAGPGNPQQQF